MSGVAPRVLEILGVVLGAAAVVAGGYDDSPGLQGIGVLVAATCLFLLVRGVVRAAVAAARGSSR